MEEWIEHDGRGVPLGLSIYAEVQVKYRNGSLGRSLVKYLDCHDRDGSLWWNSEDAPEDDIISYRVVTA